MYLKGFEISRRKIARELAETSDEFDAEVDTYIPIVVSLTPRDAYLKVELGIDRATGNRKLIIVLQRGNDEEEGRGRELGPIDPAFEQAKSCALEGPDVWEAEY